MKEFLENAKKAAAVIAHLDGKTKAAVLEKIAENLEKKCSQITDANKIDMQEGKKNSLSSALLDRLFLDKSRVGAMAHSLREIATLKEPVGRVLDGWMNEDNLKIEKVSVPIGVIGVIYESRPNVTSDVAGLCIKSGNVAILKGGKEAKNSNEAIAKVISNTLKELELPQSIVSLVPDSSREAMNQLIKEDKYLDLIIPRGGEGLIRHISENATVPVVKHDKGLCHLFVDADADVAQSEKITLNAKVQRPGVCNAIETLLVHADIAKKFLPQVAKALEREGVELRGCEKTREIISVKEAKESDWDEEYLDMILAIKVVANVDEAIGHINRHGSGHSDAILTKDYANAEKFLNEVDAACCYVNSSTRFTDGGAFGFGAEVGISTNKLHSRGPMGINDLTTYKFKIYGSGQIRN